MTVSDEGDAQSIESDAGALFSALSGPETATPYLFLHGFGMDHGVWDPVCTRVGPSAYNLAYDLPGHGRSGRHPCLAPREMADVIIADLERRRFPPAHFVGHGLGGAVAFRIAVEQPDKVRSLSLLAPIGFGPEINHRLFRRLTSADEAEEFDMLLEQMVGWTFPISPDLSSRLTAPWNDPETRRQLSQVLDRLTAGGEQVVLPLDALEEMPFAVRIIWGTQDRILPTRQSHKLPGTVATHIFERVGHLPHLEIPDAIARILVQAAGR
ncbi:MAG: alpha/beta fold hydrolase [Pseudomonadota bacterium]